MKYFYGECAIDGCAQLARYKQSRYCDVHAHRARTYGNPHLSRGLSKDERQEMHRRIVELFMAGYSTLEIADAMQVTPRTVQRVRRNHGLPGIRLRRFTSYEVELVEQMLADGCSYGEIGRTLGRNSSSIMTRWPGRGWTPEQTREWLLFLRARRKNPAYEHLFPLSEAR